VGLLFVAAVGEEVVGSSDIGLMDRHRMEDNLKMVAFDSTKDLVGIVLVEGMLVTVAYTVAPEVRHSEVYMSRLESSVG
jgi:hypothetical protein